MTQPAKPLDDVARRLIRASEEDLRRWMGTGQLESDLLSALYLRVREVLERGAADGDAMVEDIALTIYLTASAWQARAEPPLNLLTSLHRVIAVTLSTDSFPTAPPNGARRMQ
jgi:hypothetical protein